MRTMVAVVQREIVDKRRLILASLILGALTLVLPLLRIGGGMRASYGQTRDIIAAFLGFVLLNAVAIGGGMTAVARDLSERRMSFYFARPVSGLSIWAGKMLGSLLLAVACALAVVIPATLMGGGLFSIQKINSQYFSTTSPSVAFASSLLLAIIALILTHPLSIALRSRSKWLILDFVAWNVVGFGLLAIVTKVGMRNEILGHTVTYVFAGVFLFALLVGGAVQVVVGRTDLVRGHKAMSLTVWPAVATAVILLAGYVAWLESSTPRDLRIVNVEGVSADGSWLSIEGMRRFGMDYPLQFALNANDGRFLKMNMPRWSYATLVAGDSSHAVWFERRALLGSKAQFVAMWASLREPQPRAVETISFDSQPGFAISPDGFRLATIDENWTLVVTDLAGRKTLAAVHMPHSGPVYYWRVRPVFLDRDHVRVYTVSDARSGTPAGPAAMSLGIAELDVTSRTYRKTGEVPRIGYFTIDRSADRLLAFETAGKTIDLLDARTGAAIAPISRTRGSGATFIPGRRVAMCEAENGVITVKVFGFDGNLLRSIPVRRGVTGSVAWSTGPEQLLVDTYSRPDSLEMSHAVDLVDIDRGTVRSFGTTWNRRPWNRSCEAAVPHPVFNSKDDRVVELDPATGAWRDVLR